MCNSRSAGTAVAKVHGNNDSAMNKAALLFLFAAATALTSRAQAADASNRDVSAPMMLPAFVVTDNRAPDPTAAVRASLDAARHEATKPTRFDLQAALDPASAPEIAHALAAASAAPLAHAAAPRVAPARSTPATF